MNPAVPRILSKKKQKRPNKQGKIKSKLPKKSE